ncbi:MAG: relaxase/mobilization nuclease domain-containing protein, partial [Bacteroidales bacterium]|nr:relaxase/mobilization nuclease domain-containing protein [Bacteroidales bacterium]
MVKPYTYHDRSKLKKEIDYITRPGVEYIDVLNLSVYRGDYAEQLNETYRLYDKRTDKDKAAFYGYIIDYDPRDNPSPKDMHEASVRLMEMTFPDFECVIATHTDTDNVHTHVIMNSVNLVTGKKLKFTSRDLAKMIEDHIRIGESYGYTHTRVTERNPDYRTTAEVRIRERGGWGWKDDIRNFVRGAIEDIRVSTPENFMICLLDYNMDVLDTGKEFLYFHPKKTQGVRGKKLGPYYTRKSVMAAIERNHVEAERREAERLEAERLEAERKEADRKEADRKEAEKTPSITQLDEYNRIEVWLRYAEREFKNNNPYYDFNDFVEKVEEIEKRGNRVVYVSDCIDDALRNPLSEKDYGELTSEDFYREKRYALFCGECVRDKMEPVNKDTFYRDNGWEDPENRAKQEPVGQKGNKAVSIDMLDDYTKVEVWSRYAENSVKAGRSWIDFDNLVEYVK